MASSIVVASGKGGVGKTSLAVNLGLTLARQGRRTILLDADFGMANAHILIGANPQRFVMDAIQGDASMADVLCDAPHGMKFISGGSGLLEMLNLDQTTRYQTIRMVDELRDQTEVLIADVPAGASDSSIAFVAAADRVAVVLVGEPTSFLDAYSLIKAANLEADVRNFSIVVNMARSVDEAKTHFEKFKATATRFLDVSLTYAGHLPLSERMRRSVVTRRPISMDQPDLPENQAFMQISKLVLDAPANEHGGIRFFSSDGGCYSRTLMMRNQYLEQKPDVEELITSHMELVRQIAWHMHGRVYSSIEIEDLIQIGYFGLVTAAQNYTLREGATFASYAGIRIRGAIVDHLRKSSNLCRTTIEMQKKANLAGRELRNRLGREPTSAEMADHMDISEEEMHSWNQAFQANVHQSLDSVYDDFSIWFESSENTPEENINEEELRNLLKDALLTLPEREALVIQLYYVEELNVYEIAEVLEVTTGRVSQIKKSAISSLRHFLGEREALILKE